MHVPRGLLDQLERGLLVLQRRELFEPRKLSVVHPLRRQQVLPSEFDSMHELSRRQLFVCAGKRLLLGMLSRHLLERVARGVHGMSCLLELNERQRHRASVDVRLLGHFHVVGHQRRRSDVRVSKWVRRRRCQLQRVRVRLLLFCTLVDLRSVPCQRDLCCGH